MITDPSRRDFLTTGASGLGGLALASLMNGEANAAPTEEEAVVGTAVGVGGVTASCLSVSVVTLLTGVNGFVIACCCRIAILSFIAASFSELERLLLPASLSFIATLLSAEDAAALALSLASSRFN